MTKYNNDIRQELHAFVLESRATKRILTLGVAEVAEKHPGLLLTRGMGFNSRGLFSVNGERPEGSKNKWQRYFQKGCPELLEYLARVDMLQGQEFDPDSYFNHPIPRNKAGEVKLKEPVKESKEEPELELRAWVNQLPDWGELYTAKGLNFYVVFHLYKMENCANPNHKQLLSLCDEVASPYKTRICQGFPQNDADALYQYTNDRNLLMGNDVEAEYTETPEPESTDPYGDYLEALQAEATRREVAELQEDVKQFASNIRGVDQSKLVLPDTPAELRLFISKLRGIIELEKELDV